MFVKRTMIENGDYLMPFDYFKCDRCGKELPENAPREDFPLENKDFCGDCAFILGIIDEQRLLDEYYYFIDLPGKRAVIHNGEVCVGIGKFQWERKPRDRESVAYRKWREDVYERDNYTCQICGKRGGNLNAHHIKPYAKYPDLRLELSNGITLCDKCHKDIHKKRKVARSIE